MGEGDLRCHPSLTKNDGGTKSFKEQEEFKMSKPKNKFLTLTTVACLSSILLSSCVQQEKTVLGVPQSVWGQLSPAEKQQLKQAYSKRERSLQHRKMHKTS